MERITYIAPNLMDWVAQIKAGAANIKIHFSGGALTSYGVTPAEYTTENAFLQKVIERSEYFKEGRIQIGRRIAISNPAKPKSKVSKFSNTQPDKSPVAPTEGEKDPNQDKTSELTVIASEVIKQEDACISSETETPQSCDEKKFIEIEVSCLQDAQDYIQQNFGISSYKVRSKISAQKTANEHGVTFVGPGFVSATEDLEEETKETI